MDKDQIIQIARAILKDNPSLTGDHMQLSEEVSEKTGCSLQEAYEAIDTIFGDSEVS